MMGSRKIVLMIILLVTAPVKAEPCWLWLVAGIPSICSAAFLGSCTVIGISEADELRRLHPADFKNKCCNNEFCPYGCCLGSSFCTFCCLYAFDICCDKKCGGVLLCNTIEDQLHVVQPLNQEGMLLLDSSQAQGV